MANNSDIIKIGFDYESGLAEFIKNYNGTMDQVQKSADGNRIEIQFDADDKDILAKIAQLKKLKLDNFTLEFSSKGIKEQLRIFEQLEKRVQEIIDLNKGVGENVIDSESAKKVLDIFGQINDSLSSLRSVISDVGDGEEFSPLLKTVKEITNAVDTLSKSVSNIGLNVNIESGGMDQKLLSSLDAKKQSLLSAYKTQYDAMRAFKPSGTTIAMANPENRSRIAALNKQINNFDGGASTDNIDQRITAYKEIIKLMKEVSQLSYGKDIYSDMDSSFKNAVSSATGQVTRVQNELKKANTDGAGLENLFGSQDLSKVVEQLGRIADQFENIAKAASEFKVKFADGIKVESSVQEVETLTKKVKELEEEISKLKAGSETNISAPKNTTSDGAGASAEDSKVSIEGEADKLKETAQNATEAANAKLKFVDANKKVKDSAKDSADAVQGESDSFKNVNADPYSTYVQNVYKAWQQADKINDALSETQQKFQNIENTFGKSATGGSRFEELFPGVTAQIKTLDDELTQGGRTLKSYTSAIDKLLVKNPEDFLKNSESAIQKTEKNLSNLTVPSNLTSEFSNVRTEVENLNEQLRNNKISISDYKQSVSEKIGDFGSSIKEQKAALEKTLSEMNTLIGKVDYNVKTGKPVEGMRSNEYSTQMNEYKATLEELHTLQETVSKQDFVSTAQLQQFDDLKKKVKDSEAQFKLLSAAEKGSDDLSRSKLYSKIGDYLQRNSGMAKEFKVQLKALQKQIEDEGPNANVKDLTNQFIRLQSQIREAGQEGRSFLDVLKDKAFYGFVGQLGTYFGFNDIIRYGQQVATVITNLNTKFTDLAKVSESSTQQLYSDFKSYSSIAKDIGGTISDTIDATAAWAKNGYNLPDSKELARVSLLYKNVGDNIDIDTANESLVSTLKGFNLAAEDAEHIIDVFNEVSNNEAISSAGIGTALQRSAASFNAANTSLEKSVALITATNSVLQDEERTGNMWKTVSARIRGADTELKEMGEDTDGLAESTSKLRDLIKGMTGFDIMKDEDTFKDIYDIVVGIGEKWNDLSDINRAALLEKLAGKNQSNALAAALSNIDVLKKSYQEAMDAEGSARREQEKYQESIQYSIDKTKASLEELANDTISSDFVKNLVEGGNTIVNVLDNIITKLGTLPTALGALGAALSINNVGKGKMFPFMNMPTA